MKRLLFAVLLQLVFLLNTKSQDIVPAANQFINLLDESQKSLALYPFDSEERYGFHYFPISDRKGVSLNKLNQQQKDAVTQLIKTCISQQTVQQISAVMSLENILKVLENRKADDHYRDPGEYYISIFGIPGDKTVWGWRLDGHHVCFSFSVKDKKLVAATPAFLGANPAIVQQGAEAGKEVLKEEKTLAFVLLNAFTGDQLKKVVFDTAAPGDIVTRVVKKIEPMAPVGLRYTEMTNTQKQELLQLISFYIHRSTKLFADDMLKQIQKAGLDNLWFGWAGVQASGPGKPHYYRIQGPTILIEYDNTQNNANHVHTVVRDLQNDFGGDPLLEHYKASH